MHVPWSYLVAGLGLQPIHVSTLNLPNEAGRLPLWKDFMEWETLPNCFLKADYFLAILFIVNAIIYMLR